MKAYSQPISNLVSIEFYENKTIEELEANDLVLDKVEENNIILFVSIKISDGIMDFFRLDDSTYVSRTKIGEEYNSKGIYKIDLNAARSRDTTITFDIDTYTEHLKVFSRHELVELKE